MTGAACFLPNWVKDLSAPRLFVYIYIYVYRKSNRITGSGSQISRQLTQGGKFSALRTVHLYPQQMVLVLISVRG